MKYIYNIEVMIDTGQTFDIGTFDSAEEADECLQNYARSLNDSEIGFIGGNGTMVSTKHVIYMRVSSEIYMDSLTLMGTPMGGEE